MYFGRGDCEFGTQKIVRVNTAASGDTFTAGSHRRKISRKLWLFCAVMLVLSLISFIPGILVIATFLVVVPGLILACAPEMFLVSATVLAGRLLFPRADGAGRRTVTGVLIGAYLLASAGAAAFFNHPIQTRIQELSRDDHDLQGTLGGARHIAIRVVTANRLDPVSRPARRKPKRHRQPESDTIRKRTPDDYCGGLCLHLLFNGLADSVLVTSVSRLVGDLTPGLAESATRFGIERRDVCPDVSIHLRDSFLGAYDPLIQQGDEASERNVLGQIAAGKCLIAEPASLSEADIIVQVNPYLLPWSPTPRTSMSMKVLQLGRPMLEARRISIYQVHADHLEERFRQTTVYAEPLLPLLLLGPVFTGEGGIGISEGFLRSRKVYSACRIHEIFKTKLGLDMSPISG